jgi:hypothetical protein
MKEFPPPTRTARSQRSPLSVCAGEGTSRPTALRNSKCLQTPTLKSCSRMPPMPGAGIPNSNAQKSIVTASSSAGHRPPGHQQRFVRCAEPRTICTIAAPATAPLSEELARAAPHRRQQHLAKINRHRFIFCNLAPDEPASLSLTRDLLLAAMADNALLTIFAQPIRFLQRLITDSSARSRSAGERI